MIGDAGVIQQVELFTLGFGLPGSAVALAIVACSAPPKPVDAAKPKATVVRVTEAPQPSTPIEPGLPLPPVPDGADPETFRIAASICAVAVAPRSGRNVEVGCRSHPPFVEPSQKPDGRVVTHSEATGDFCAIEAIYPGSFTRPHTRQVAVVFAACDDAAGNETAWDASNPGSVVVVEQTGTRWNAVAAEREVDATKQRCQPYHRADGVDLLVCSSTFQGGFDFGMPQPSVVALEFLYDGHRFVATENTRTHLEQWQAAAARPDCFRERRFNSAVSEPPSAGSESAK